MLPLRSCALPLQPLSAAPTLARAEAASRVRSLCSSPLLTPARLAPSELRHQQALLGPQQARQGSRGRERRVTAGATPNDSSDQGQNDDDTPVGDGEGEQMAEAFRRRMEELVVRQGRDEVFFDGRELARMIFGKYGRSYDVTFMKQEFMGRKLLAMNVMWKYREQKSFPLTEEEYLFRLDRVADNLRCWGAVEIVRESLAATKERPRIGKAVSIRIDLDDSGERAMEWISR